MNLDELDKDLELQFNDEFDLNEYKCIEVDADVLGQLSNGWYVKYL